MVRTQTEIKQHVIQYKLYIHCKLFSRNILSKENIDMADTNKDYDSLEGILNCPVCFEDYRPNDDNAIPRLLPCSHTLCGKCTQGLIQKNSLQCPECRKRHPVENGAKSFPQNKYILLTVRRKTSLAEEKPQVVQQNLETCLVHGRELGLYCSEASCQNEICSLCLTSSHRGHDVVDLMQLKKEKYEYLVANVSWLRKSLKCNRDKFVSSKEEIEEKMEMCLEMLRKNEVIQKAKILKILSDTYEKFKQSVDNRRQKTLNKVEGQIQMIDTLLNLSGDILKNTDPKASSHQDIQSNNDIIERLGEEIEGRLSTKQTYEYFSYSENEDDKVVEKMFAKLVPEETSTTIWNSEELQRSSLTTPTPVAHSNFYSDLDTVKEEISTDLKCTGKPYILLEIFSRKELVVAPERLSSRTSNSRTRFWTQLTVKSTGRNEVGPR